MTDLVEYDFGDDIDREPTSAKPYLQAIADGEKHLDRWQTLCDRIDRVYSALQTIGGISASGDGIFDEEFNLFWASMEVVKPSIYSRPPIPVVTPAFKDRNPVKRVAADMLERTAIANFGITDINQVMLGARDDLALNERGVVWLSYEDGKEEKVCIEHLHRRDFGHDSARSWAEVDKVWRHAWLSREEARERFESISGDLYSLANYTDHPDKQSVDDIEWSEGKAKFTEVWCKSENKVVWVTENVDTVLDEDEPHLKLKGFFPCPKPAYGTVERGSLKPVPSFVYIQTQLEGINTLTQRIHDLIDKLVVKGIIPSGTDVGDAVEKAYREVDAAHMLIPVPSLSMSGANSLVEWLPIEQVANTILAAVQARRELIGNVQEILGIADIMRGDTDAQETLGAQQLKAQYGSIRVRDRVNELVRLAKDTVEIMAEIVAEEFSFDTLLTMSQMELPTNAEIKKQLKLLQDASEKELKALADQAEQAAMSPQAQENPQAIEQQFQQAQQQVIEKYAPQVQKLQTAVTQEQVKDLIRDNKTRCFVFDIETDSTIYPDEQAAKQASSELAQALGNSLPIVQSMIQMGGADAAGELIKEILAPYRPSRTFLGALDELIDRIKDNPAPGQGTDEAAKALAESQMVLAQAETEKARAAMAKVQADSQLKQAELQGQMQKMQMEFQEKAGKLQLENGKLQLQASKQEQEFQAKMAEMDAKQNLMQAQTAEILAKIGLDVRKQDLEEYKAATETQFQAEDQARAAESTAFDQEQRLVDGERQDRNTDRQMSLAEQEAMNRGNP